MAAKTIRGKTMPGSDKKRQGHSSEKMGSEPMQRLLLSSAIPMMLSLLFNTLYNTVDGIFVAKISEEALTAVSLSAPMQMLMAAIGNGIAIGMNAVLSKALGEKNREKVECAVTAGILLALISYAALAVAGITAVRPFFRWQAAGNDVIMEYGCRYLLICMIGSIGFLCQYVFDRCLISSGKSMLFLCSLGCASAINLILDPVLIFGIGPFPEMGITGAALATVTGQICGGFISLSLGLRWNHEVPVRFPGKIACDVIKEILRTGIPTALMNGGVSAVGVLINTILIAISPTLVAVYGICLRVQNLTLIGVHGICLTMIPIVAYNYGAKNKERIRECFRLAVTDSLVIYGIITVLLELFPAQILRLFSSSADMMSMGIPAIRLLAASWLISVLGILVSHLCQAFGKAVYSMVLTILRQAVLLLPVMLVFQRIGGIHGIWIAFLATELMLVPAALGIRRKFTASL